MRMTARLIRPGFLAGLLALFAADAAVAQDPAAPPPGDGANEGVAVHGHWTISIVRDGEVVERREFENALMTDGTGHLTDLLTRTSSAGNWLVLVTAPGLGGLCTGDTVDGSCSISEDDAELTASSASDGSGGQQLVLEGSDTATRDGDISSVGTFQAFCTADTTPAACTFDGGRTAFTATDLSPTMPVLSGDRIDVMVEISFN